MKVETISRKEAIAWLAGVLDGEGCIYAFWQKETKGMIGRGMRVAVQTSGTHPALIAKVTRVLLLLGIGFNIHPVRKDKYNENWRTCATVMVTGKGRVRKLLEAVLPHLTEKRSQAELVLKLIDYRESLPKAGERSHVRYGGSFPMHLSKDPVMIHLVDRITKAKKEYPSVLEFSRRPNEEFGSQSSETLRRQLRSNEVKIKSELHGDMQTAQETSVA